MSNDRADGLSEEDYRRTRRALARFVASWGAFWLVVAVVLAAL